MSKHDGRKGTPFVFCSPKLPSDICDTCGKDKFDTVYCVNFGDGGISKKHCEGCHMLLISTLLGNYLSRRHKGKEQRFIPKPPEVKEAKITIVTTPIIPESPTTKILGPGTMNEGGN